MRARSEEEISKLSERVQHLQKLYENQELIISKKSGHFYLCYSYSFKFVKQYHTQIVIKIN